MFYDVINKPKKKNLFIYLVLLFLCISYITLTKLRQKKKKKKDIYYLIYQKLFDLYTFYVFKNVILKYVNYNLFNKKGLI